MLTVRRMLPAACTLAAVSMLALACSGSDGTVTVVLTVPLASSVEATSVPATLAPATPAPITGIIEIDRVIDAAERGDVIKLAELTRYAKLPCTTDPATPPQIGDPPGCTGEESDGTDVEALPVTICEGGWARPEQAVRAYRAALAGGPARAESVYVPKSDVSEFESSLGEQYVVVLRVDDPAGPKEVALHLTGGRVAWVEMACPADADLTGPDRALSFLLSPTAAPPTTITVEPQPTQ